VEKLFSVPVKSFGPAGKSLNVLGKYFNPLGKFPDALRKFSDMQGNFSRPFQKFPCLSAKWIEELQIICTGAGKNE
jgi:hypothetical protein